jgi:histone deacetylase 1/2
VEYVLSKGIPTMMLGGGGYTIENVACCWANETAVSLKIDLDNNIPTNDKFYDSYSINKNKLRILVFLALKG